MAHKTINLEELPYRISMRKAQYRGPWQHGKGTYHPVNGLYPYRQVQRILDNFIGKPVNDAFSKFCKIVPSYQYKYFWQEINPSKFQWRNLNYYCVDSEGFVQESNRHINPKITKVKSWDAKYGYIDTRTNKPQEWYTPAEYRGWGLLKGTIYEFSSKDFKYWRKWYEENSKKRAYNRNMLLINKVLNSDLNFVTKAELASKKSARIKHEMRVFTFEMLRPDNPYELQYKAYQALLVLQESED